MNVRRTIATWTIPLGLYFGLNAIAAYLIVNHVPHSNPDNGTIVIHDIPDEQSTDVVPMPEFQVTEKEIWPKPPANPMKGEWGIGTRYGITVSRPIGDSEGIGTRPIQANPETVFLFPCETEDSDDCFWNANTRSNGVGWSFVNINGDVYYLWG